MRSDILVVILFAALVLIVPVDVFAEDEEAEEDLKIMASSDVWVSAGDGQRSVSMSRTQILKIAGEKEMALIDFDCAKLTGRTIIKGELFVHQVVVEERFPQQLVVSTVTNRWVEGRNSILYREDPVGKGATFEHASYGTSFWTKEGSSLRDVVMGKGYSLFQRSEPLPTGGRWWKVELDQNIIRALVTESSYGLYVTGEWGEVSRECSIHASESGKYAPYLLLECQPAREVEIPAPDFLAEREADEDGVPTGRIVISLDVPAGVFSYDILVNSDPVPRWEIPLAAAPGTKQKFTVHGPRDEGAVPVKMFAIGHVGDASDPARVRADLPIPTIEAPAE